MSSWEPIAEQLPPLLQAFRNMSPSRQPNMLALEVFLLCAQEPRTYDELERLTGCHRTRIEKAVSLLTVKVSQEGEVRAPAMHLLRMERITGTRLHRFSITDRGRRLLDGKG